MALNRYCRHYFQWTFRGKEASIWMTNYHSKCRINKMKTYVALMICIYSMPALAGVTLKASYREAANIFDIMDCSSNWWDGYCNDDGEYQKEWIRRFKLSDKDKELFTQYKNVREKYYSDVDGKEKDPSKNPNGFFSRTGQIQEDRLAKTFYGAANLNDAFKKLADFVEAKEIEFLKKFYKHFEPDYSKILGESKVFARQAEDLDRYLQNPKFTDFVNKIARFYRVDVDLKYEVLLNWWPPLKATNASPTDQFLVLRVNPTKHPPDKSRGDAEVTFHEVVHTVSARQNQKQKQQVTKKFLDICPVYPKLKKGWILEEPLAVVLGQFLFLAEFSPKELNFDQSAYNNQWIDAYAKKIYETVKASFAGGKTITDDDLILKLGKLCLELMPLAEKTK